MSNFRDTIGLIIVYNNNPCKIDKSDTQYFIATNIIVNKKQTIPIINIENNVSKPIKFKLLIRKYCKKEFKLRIKDIIRIKHVNNINNQHNYLVIIKPNKYILNLKNILGFDEFDDIYLRTFFQIYTHRKGPFNLKDSYSLFTKASTKLNLNNDNTIEIGKIYKLLGEYYN